MKVVVQKVNYATVSIENDKNSIDYGILVIVGVNRYDTIKDVEYIAKKIVGMRIFKDDSNKLTKNLFDVNGQIMVLPNFTLQAEIRSGTRPNFSHSADDKLAYDLYTKLIQEFKNLGVEKVEQGFFKNHMHVDCNLDGPFNIILDTDRCGKNC